MFYIHTQYVLKDSLIYMQSFFISVFDIYKFLKYFDDVGILGGSYDNFVDKHYFVLFPDFPVAAKYDVYYFNSLEFWNSKIVSYPTLEWESSFVILFVKCVMHDIPSILARFWQLRFNRK